MTGIFLPRRWRRKPSGPTRLNPACSLVREPLFIHAMNGDGISLTGHHHIGGTSMAYSVTPEGIALSAPATVPQFSVPAGPFSIFVRFSTTDTRGAIFGGRSTASETPLIDLAVGHNGVVNVGPGKVAGIIRDSADVLACSGADSSVLVNDGRWHTAIQKRDRAGYSSISVDGNPFVAFSAANVATGAISNLGQSGGANYLDETRNDYDIGRLSPGLIALGGLVLQEFSNEDARALHSEPWQILAPHRARLYFLPSAGGGATISGGLESISLATFAATVGSARAIAGAVESIALTSNAATVSTDRAVTAAVESITITASAATVSSDRAIAGAVESVALTTNPATVALGVNVGAATESVSLTANPATVALDAAIAATLESITVTGLTATVSAGSDNNISAQLESITVTVNPATVSRDSALAAALESLTVTPHAASIAVGQIVAAALESLTLTSYPAGIALDVAIAAQLEQINLATFAAQVGLGTNVAALTEALTLTPHGATITFAPSVGAATEHLTLATFAAVVGATEAALLSPGLEFTIPLSRMGYTIPVSRVHFTIPQE